MYVLGLLLLPSPAELVLHASCMSDSEVVVLQVS